MRTKLVIAAALLVASSDLLRQTRARHGVRRPAISREIAVKKKFLASVAALSMSVAIPVCVDAETISDQAIRAAKKKALVTLPPVEYDKPFAGKLEEVVVKSREEMEASCKRIGFSEPRVPLACGKLLAADHCVLYLARDEVYRSVGVTTELVRRHEVGHCNGWPKDHPGGRSVTE
jgi:hypothetical protein